MDFEKFLKLYDYSLPSELIAKKPAIPRDSAKLLVFNRKTGEVFFDKFYNLTAKKNKCIVNILIEVRQRAGFINKN